MENPLEHEKNPARTRILVVEDDEDLRLTIYDWLVLRGHAVMAAGDGLEALVLIERQEFDIVLTDHKMPRCDGLHLLSAVKARDARIQVIFLTGEASMEDAISALREGRSFDFLQKPLHDYRRLDEVIARALAHRAQLDAVPRVAEETALPRLGLPESVVEAIAGEPVLTRAFHFIEAHLHEPLSLREVAAATEYTPSYLTNRMRLKTGKTVQQWILELKMSEAKHLLSSTDWSVQRIAATLGYQDANYFHRQFRQVFDMSPQTWRQDGMGAER
jgi:YesN/AraC family two-component response regulator